MAEIPSVKFRPPSPSPSPLSGEEMEELELPPLPKWDKAEEQALLDERKGQDPNESMTVDQRRHLADVESSFRVDVHGGAVPLPESDEEDIWAQDVYDHDADEQDRNDAYNDAYDDNEFKKEWTRKESDENMEQIKPEEIGLPTPDEDDELDAGYSDMEYELPPPPPPQPESMGEKSASPSQREVEHKEPHDDWHDDSSDYSYHGRHEEETREVDSPQLPYHEDDEYDHDEHEYPSAPSSPEPEEAYPPVPSSPEPEDAYPPVPSSPEPEDEYPPVPSSPEPEEEHSPAPSSPEPEEEHPFSPEPEPEHDQSAHHSDPDLTAPVLDDTDEHEPSSSPTTAAHARALSRAASNLSIGTGVSTKDRNRLSPMPYQEAIGLGINQNPSATSSIASKMENKGKGKNEKEMPPPTLPATKPGRQSRSGTSSAQRAESTGSARSSSFKSTRPKFLRSRRESQRSNASSVHLEHDSDHDDGSAVAGEMPLPLSRSTSLGSIASGITGLGVYAPPELKPTPATGLDRLDEESQSRLVSPVPGGDKDRPSTPKDRLPPQAPTDTVITAQVKDIRVPPTIARDFQTRHQLMNPAAAPGSPNKKALASAAGATPAANRGREMTLKEQTASIDRLQKENFDLKIKVYYLNEKLEKMSDESVKEALQENIDMKVKLAEFMREKKAMKKQIKDLEKELEELGGEVERKKDEEEMAQEEEVWELRQRIETYEIEIEEYRRKEAEREQRMEEFRREAEMGAQHGEEVEQLREILASETARREAVDAENNRLREEIYRLHASPTPHLSTAHSMSERDRSQSRAGGSNSDSRVVMNQLNAVRRENEDLRREVAAQTSMLTSRNREKDRLYQEIEDLKLRIRGSSSHTGMSSFTERDRAESRHGAQSAMSDHDRILDRSVSRVGAISATGTTLTESERENYEDENAQLRDKISVLKLTNSDLQQQIEDAYSNLEARNQDLLQIESDIAVAHAEVQEMQAERNDALRMNEELQMDFEQLREEAQEEIMRFEELCEARGEEIEMLKEEIRNREDDFRSLQQEMRSVSDVVVRLEDVQEHHQGEVRRLEEKIEDLEHTIRVNEQEMIALEGSLREANEKVERMTVQSESAKNEIAFLREEQDADKIKIGELESHIKRMEKMATEEQGRVRDLKERLQAERKEREELGDARIQEWEKKVNEKNEEVMKGKEEVRRLRSRVAQRDEEVKEWRKKLEDLEKGLKSALGDTAAVKGGLIKSVLALQQNLAATLSDLSNTKSTLTNTLRLLSDREKLLEKTSHENRQLSEKLEKERYSHRQSRNSLELAQTSNHTSSRNFLSNQSHQKDLDRLAARNEREVRKLEMQMKDLLKERNELLVAAFHRLAAICGKDWAQRNSTITITTTSSLPSPTTPASSSSQPQTTSISEKIAIDTILLSPSSPHFPSAARTFLLAVKTLESIFYGFKARLKTLERDLWKDYSTLETSLDTKAKKIDRLENLARATIQEQKNAKIEIQRLRSDNRMLKAEVNLLRDARERELKRDPVGMAAEALESGFAVFGRPEVPRSGSSRGSPAVAAAAAAAAGGAGGVGTAAGHRPPQLLTPNPQSPNPSTSQPPQPQPPQSPSTASRETDKKWILRLRELEKRLKAEREARLLDRTMAKRNIEEAWLEREEIRKELEKEREAAREREERERTDGGGGAGPGGGAGKGKGKR